MPAGSVTITPAGGETKDGLAEDIYDARVAMLAGVTPPGEIPPGPLGYPIKNGLALDATALAGAIYPAILAEVTGGLGALIPPGVVLAYGAASAPTGWLLCNAAAVSRTTYAALFAIIGTTYGIGDGATTFNLPDGRGRALIGSGTGDAVDATAHSLGSKKGTETHTLTEAQMPSHSHQSANGTALISKNIGSGVYAAGVAGNDWTDSSSTTAKGSGDAHPNMQPSITVNWIIKT